MRPPGVRRVWMFSREVKSWRRGGPLVVYLKWAAGPSMATCRRLGGVYECNPSGFGVGWCCGVGFSGADCVTESLASAAVDSFEDVAASRKQGMHASTVKAVPSFCDVFKLNSCLFGLRAKRSRIFYLNWCPCASGLMASLNSRIEGASLMRVELFSREAVRLKFETKAYGLLPGWP